MKKRTKIKEPLLLRAIRWSYPKIERIIPSLAHTIAWNLFFSPFKFKRPSRENKAFETAKKSTIKVNDKEVAIFEWGTSGNPVALFVHGWSGRATQFFKFIEPLIDSGYHVVAFDAPAHGLSEGKMSSIKEFNDAIIQIEEHVGKIKVGIGHSLGGVSLLFAMKNGVKIDSLVMISSPTIGEDILNNFRAKLNASPRTSSAIRKMVIDKFDLDFEEITAVELAKKFIIKKHFIIHDKDDLEVPYSNAESLKVESPYAKLLLTKGLGHTRILRDNKVIKEVLDEINSDTIVPINSAQQFADKEIPLEKKHLQTSN